MDKRNIDDTDGMFQAICDHIEYSYNNGTVRPTITVFRKRQDGIPDMRVWNQLMISLAGYSIESTTESQLPGDETTTKKIGDQVNLGFTRVSKFTYNIFKNFKMKNIISHHMGILK